MKALVTWAVKANENLFHSGWQDHCLLLVFKEKGSAHYFPHMLKGNDCIGMELCLKHWLPVLKQHTLKGGTKSKVGKTTMFRRGKSFRAGISVSDLHPLNKYLTLLSATTATASREAQHSSVITYLHVCSARTLGMVCIQASLLCHQSKEFPVETRG